MTKAVISSDFMFNCMKSESRRRCSCFCLFDLLLYVLTQQIWSCGDGQFTEPHFFLGRLEQAVNQ